MVKRIRNNKNYYILEKYILIILLIGYLVGTCIGCYYIFSSSVNAVYAKNIINYNDF